MTRIITAPASRVTPAAFHRAVCPPPMSERVAALTDTELAGQYGRGFDGEVTPIPLEYLLGEILTERRRGALKLFSNRALTETIGDPFLEAKRRAA